LATVHQCYRQTGQDIGPVHRTNHYL